MSYIFFPFLGHAILFTTPSTIFYPDHFLFFEVRSLFIGEIASNQTQTTYFMTKVVDRPLLVYRQTTADDCWGGVKGRRTRKIARFLQIHELKLPKRNKTAVKTHKKIMNTRFAPFEICKTTNHVFAHLQDTLV